MLKVKYLDPVDTEKLIKTFLSEYRSHMCFILGPLQGWQHFSTEESENIHINEKLNLIKCSFFCKTEHFKAKYIHNN